MNNNFIKKTLSLIFLFTLIIGYQNCGSYESNSASPNKTKNSPNFDQNSSAGESPTDSADNSTAPPASEQSFKFIDQPVIKAITHNSAQIEWKLSEVGTGEIQYWQNNSLIKNNIPETSFKYSKHGQSIFNLEPNTLYFYQVKSVNQTSKELKSEVFNFKTPDKIAEVPVNTGPVIEGWNDNLPLGGRAIGVVTYGLTTGNARLVSHKSSRRFLATRSGEVKSFAYLNRVLTAGDIERRAITKRDTEPVWYKMQQALGNDPKRGGYMLANSYSVGNGGLQEVTLQTDSGAPDHLPSGTVVATSNRFIPFDLPIEKVVHINFNQTGVVQAGQIYHLVFHNLTPPHTALRNLSSEEAKNAPIDRGAISLDGTSQGHLIEHPSDRQGPFMRDIPATLVKNSASSNWERTNINAFFSITYVDDIEVGEMYAHIHGQGAYKYEVSGNKKLRQQITWNYPDITVDRVVTRFGHRADANGQPMNVVIKNQSLVQLASGSIPFDPILKAAAQSSSWFINNQTRHAVSNLSKKVTLVKGQTYYIEYSAPAGAGYVMSPALDPALTRHGSNDSNMLAKAFAQQSTNGGTNWGPLNAFPTGDLAMYLIPVGVPTKTPIP